MVSLLRKLTGNSVHAHTSPHPPDIEETHTGGRHIGLYMHTHTYINFLGTVRVIGQKHPLVSAKLFSKPLPTKVHPSTTVRGWLASDSDGYVGRAALRCLAWLAVPHPPT